MLKMTKIELELIPDPDMYIFFEKVTKGGFPYIFNRAKVNHMTQNKNQKIIHLDVNNSYGYAINFFQQVDTNGYILKGLT